MMKHYDIHLKNYYLSYKYLLLNDSNNVNYTIKLSSIKDIIMQKDNICIISVNYYTDYVIIIGNNINTISTFKGLSLYLKKFRK
jgi:hypothetical protein